MNLSKRRSRLICWTSIILAMLIIFGFAFSGILNNQVGEIAQADTATTAASRMASVVNLNAKGVETNAFGEMLTGGQNEYIYYGSNTSTGKPVLKWKVLSGEDTKYTDGDIFLWSDAVLGSSNQYSDSNTSVYGAYWSTSKMRATLNGGKYYGGSSVSDLMTIADSNSYLGKYFSDKERQNIAKTKDYISKCYTWAAAHSKPQNYTTGIVGNGNEQYKASDVNTVISRASNVRDASITTDGSSIIETTSDYIFLLDYYDMNTHEYGFYDKADGMSYAEKVADSVIPGWTFASDGYPSCYDIYINGINYLKSSNNYWLRTVGRSYSQQGSTALIQNVVLYANCEGRLTYGQTAAATDMDTRPAFNLSSPSVVYASTTPTVGTTFTKVDATIGAADKPAYKVYTKSSGYVNYNAAASGKPSITVSGNNISVTKSGQTGKAIFLISKGSSGEVMYQANCDFNASGVATAALPASAVASDYTVTVLFADTLRGGYYAEEVTGSYTQWTLTNPQDTTAVYNGSVRTAADFASEAWYNASIYGDISKVEVTIPTNAITVNDYTVSFTIKDQDITWADGTRGKKDITLKVNQKPVSITWTNDADGIPDPSIDASEICSNSSGIADTVSITSQYTGTLTVGNKPYTDTSNKPAKAGNYTVTAQSLSNGNYKFADDAVKSKTFKLDIKELSEPSILETSWWKYSGDTQTYTVDGTSYNPKYLELTIPTVFKDEEGLAFDPVGNIIAVLNANDANHEFYYLNVHIKDPDNARWADTKTTEDRQLKFKVLPYDIEIELNGGDGLLSGVYKEDTEIDIEVTTEIFPDHNLVVDIVGIYNNAPYKLLESLQFDEDSVGNVLTETLSTAKLLAKGNYELSMVLRAGEADNRNFNIVCNDVTLAIDEAGHGRDIWRITAGSKKYYGSRHYENMGTTTVVYTGAIPYDSKVTYGIELTPGTDGLTVDNYNSEGYVNGYLTVGANASNSDVGKNADVYTTSVRVKDGSNNITIYTITWTVSPHKFDLSKVKWKDDGKYEYTGEPITPSLEGLPEELEVKNLMGANTSGTAVNTYGNVTATFKIKDGYLDTNYILPEQGEADSYDGDFTWTVAWQIIPVQIKLVWDYKDAQDVNDVPFRVLVLSDSRVADKIDYEYYETDSQGNILSDTWLSEDQIEVNATQVKYYKAKPVLQSLYQGNYAFPEGEDLYSYVFGVGGDSTAIAVNLASNSYVYTGKEVALKWASGTPVASLNFTYYQGDVFGNKIDYVPKTMGAYWVEVTSKNPSVVLSGDTKFQFNITKNVISSQWKEGAKPPVLANLTRIQLQEGVKYEFYDADMHEVDFSALSAGGTFKIRAVLKDTLNFEFDDQEVETETIEFTVASGEELKDPSDINNPNYKFDDEDPNNPPSGDIGSGNTTPGGNNGGGGSVDFGKVSDFIKSWWQPIASAISIILIVLFMAKGVGYANKRKQTRQTTQRKYANYYAGATGLFGLATSAWTAIACVLMGLAVVSFVFMLIEKKGYNKALLEQDEAKDEYDQKKKEEEKEEARQRDENMRMMLMGMMGGNGGGMAQGMPQGAYMGGGYGLGVDEMRGLISETVTALLPNMQQALPQQASTNDDLVNRLIEQNEKLMEKLEHQSVERVVEREVAAVNTDDETIKQLIRSQEQFKERSQKQDETIKQLMEKIVELSSSNKGETQVVEKVIEKEVPVEKIVEKVVEVPVEVEKIVEKEVKVEVPVEKVVEKIIEKEVKVAAAAKPKKEVAPRLTLDEAYALLSKQQQKYFDGLRQYALSKPNAKEKTSTYAIT
ncbi:MAG: hypothetical protein K2M75_05170, partial [Clostridia bacterium]|nr:hypothetical protein [Clostridia bacterium]